MRGNRPSQRYFHRTPKKRRKRRYARRHAPKRPPIPAAQPGQVFSDAEPSVVFGLHRRGVGQRMSKKLDNTYKIDSLVEEIDPGPSGMAPIGLQITQSMGNLQKIQTFVEEASKWPGIGPLLYAEIFGTISRPMLTALRDALLALWLDPKRQARPAWRVTVYTNGNIEWHIIG